MTKISELGKITGAATSYGDLFVVVNLAQGDNGTKNITRREVVKAIQKENFDAINITGGSISNVTINNSPITNSPITSSDISASNFSAGNIDTTNISSSNIYNSTILLKTSNLANTIPELNEVQLGELLVNTYDGKIYYKRSKDTVDTMREVGLPDRVSNVYYVSESGDDSNNGTTLAESFASLDKALQVVTAVRNSQTDSNYSRITIYVKSGDYDVTNPVNIPRNVSLIGDNLRNTTLRPVNHDKDLFYVNNGVYLAGFAFKGLAAPIGADLLANPELSPSVVSYNPDGSAGIITQSPYVQNCTSISTTGTGMRVDGRYAQGLRSMVVDAFTQYNQGGIGICMLNRGYMQLVSVFTICCDIAVFCKNGGFCSITNSNSSFGNYGLVADGVSETLYSGTVVTQIATNQVKIKDLKSKPNVGDAIKFSSNDKYFTVSSSTELTIDSMSRELPDYPVLQPDTGLITARTLVVNSIPTIQVNTIAYINKKFPSFVYNQDLCSRDVATLINSAIDDTVLETNYRSILAGGAYARATAKRVIDDQLTETLDAIGYVRDECLSVLRDAGYSISSTEYVKLNENFNSIITIIQNSGITSEVIDFNTANTALIIPDDRISAKDILQANRDFFIAEGIAYIEANRTKTTFTYDKEKCARDVGYIIDAVSYDIMFDSNFRSISAGRAYLRGTSSTVVENEKIETISAIEYLNTLAVEAMGSNTVAAEALNEKFAIILNILDNGISVVPTIVNTNPSNILNGYLYAVNQIHANRLFIAEEVIHYISTNYPSLSYSQDLCRRDIGYILDAIEYDLTYGGNLETIVAAKAYYVGTQIQIGNNERLPSYYAYMYMSDVVRNVIRNNVTPTQFVQAYTYTGNVGSSSAGISGRDLVISIALYIKDTTAITAATPDTSWVASILTTAFTILQNNKNSFGTAVVNYVDQAFVKPSTFSYDETKCARDVGYILDAVGYDFMLGSNFRSISAGRAYLRGTSSTVIDSEKTQTIDAINHLKTLVNNVLVDSRAKTSANTSFTTITNIIQNGAGSIPSISNPVPVTLDVGYSNALTMIENNRLFITEEVIYHINNLVSPPVYDESLCRRDIGYILDAIEYDLTYGGNLETIVAAYAYFVGNNLQIGSSETAATVNAYQFMATLLSQVVLNTATVTPGQTSEAFVSGTAGSSNAATAAYNKVHSISAYINDQTAITPVTPDISWVDSGLVTDFNTLTSDKIKFGDEIVNYVNETYVYQNSSVWAFSYDQNKCARDVGYILDAVSYDVMFGSNFASITAGKAYLRGTASTVLSNERTQTIGALQYLKSLVATAVENADITQLNIYNILNAIESRMTLIIDIIKNGEISVPSIVNPVPNNIDSGYYTATININANRTFIENQTIDYINVNYPSVANTYSESTCRRDIQFIIDALEYDLTYGGNLETSIAARAYYVGTDLQIGSYEKEATIQTYTYMTGLIHDVVLDTASGVGYVSGNTASTASANTAVELMTTLVNYLDTQAPITTVKPNTSWVSTDLITTYNTLQNNKFAFATSVIDYVNKNYSFSYNYSANTCARDIGFVIDAITYDLLYGGNQQSLIAADAYYSAGISVIPPSERQPTINTYTYLRDISAASVQNISASLSANSAPYQTVVTQDTSLTPATSAETNTIISLFDLLIKIIEEGYTSTVTMEEQVTGIPDNDTVTFHQYSLITSSSHAFEWVGAGININTALPSLGGVPDQTKNAVNLNGGNVYYTGTDQKGDFYIGNELKINRALGTIEGRVFRRSLYSILTPYILALGEG